METHSSMHGIMRRSLIQFPYSYKSSRQQIIAAYTASFISPYGRIHGILARDSLPMVFFGEFSCPHFCGGRIMLADRRCAVVDNPTRDLRIQTCGRQPAEAQQPVVHPSCLIPSANHDTPTRSLPDEFGDWNAVYHPFCRWGKSASCGSDSGNCFCAIDDALLHALFIRLLYRLIDISE